MKIVFCLIGWMKHYRGNDDDLISGNESYLKENKTGGEIYNFRNYNGKCYGYFMYYGNQVHIERIHDAEKNTDTVENVLVVWVAGGKIVGWYENATVYRYCQPSPFHFEDEYEDEYAYNVSADAHNCFLLPEEKRTFIIPTAKKNGKGRGTGSSRIWYADDDIAYTENILIPSVLNYIEEYKANDGEFDNAIDLP